MSMIGVYPNINMMNKDQLIQYCYFIESQAIEKELDLEKQIKNLEKKLEENNE